MPNKRPCMLLILDGWGISPAGEGNAVSIARTPTLDRLMQEYPRSELLCSGQAVGLPDGIMGNSEVGHLNIGAGRVVYQDILRIDLDIREGKFPQNDALNSVMSKVKANGSRLHLMGLVSDGGVHSHLNHLLALLEMARARQVKNVFVHAILDGRDTAPDAGIRYLKQVQEHLDSNVSGRIATICGRYFAMDRDNRWDRIEKAFQLYTRAEGTRAQNPLEAVSSAYQQNQTDEFVQPIAITGGDGTPLTTVDTGDGIIFFNFRADRARQITRSFTDPEFSAFQRDPFPELCEFVCMTQYDEKFDLPVAYGPVHLDGILGEVISRHGLAQLRIAETEKYAHVTYFFNGGEERPFHLEDRCLIPSPRDVATYDLKPEMSALKVTEEVVKRIDRDQYSLIILNYANMDMVGHTGVIAAAVKACEVVDSCIDKVVTSIRARNGVLLITADHGNAEKMKSGNGGVHTAHTCNPVPFVLVDDSRKRVKLRSGILGDIAPTILDIMEIDKPKQMTGRSLIER